MTAEVDFVLEVLDGDYSLNYGVAYGGDLTSAPLQRVNRDDAKALDMDGHPRKREGDLQTANFVGVSFADRSTEPVGTEYDHSVEAVVGVRIEGLHANEYGHIDPDDTDGVPFERLVRRVRNAILVHRRFPQVGRANTSYKDLFITNEAPQSANYRDYYRHDFDVAFRGFEDLP